MHKTKLLFLLLVSSMLLPFVSQSQLQSRSIQISGTLSSDYTGLIFLRYDIVPNETKMYSIQAQAGKFSLSVNIIEPTVAVINTATTNSAEYLYLDTMDMTVIAELDSSLYNNTLIKKISIKGVSGSPTHSLFRFVQSKWSSITESDLEPEIKADKLFNFFDSLVKLYPDNPVILQAFLFSEILSYQQANHIFLQFSAKKRQLASTNGLDNFLKRLRRTEVGEVIEFIGQKNKDDEIFPTIYRSSRKVIFVEFWASWCYPCRAKHQELKAIFDEFRAKGIEIISVSLDTDKQKWLRAVNDDKMGWINISDLQGFAGNMAQYYTLKYLPFNLVVDPNGKILYKNISFADLRIFLKDSLTE